MFLWAALVIYTDTAVCSFEYYNNQPQRLMSLKTQIWCIHSRKSLKASALQRVSSMPQSEQINELELHNNSWSLRVSGKPTLLRLIKLFNITGCLERASMRSERNFHNQDQSMPNQNTENFNDTLVSVGLRGNSEVSRTCSTLTTKVNNLCKEGFWLWI